tara:strand:+ start:5296 stop:6078 length:783 start_codon:yes stop_codon:yes gene_type:complete
MIFGKYAVLMILISFASSALSKGGDLTSPKLTEVWQPVKKIQTNDVPSDAIVLFDGTNAGSWEHANGKLIGQPVKWDIENGVMTIAPRTKGPQNIRTKEKFCDMQLHIEWRIPNSLKNKQGQRDGNSGIFIQGRYEVQILNSYNNETYANGQAGAIYKQSIPLVNASKPVMEWQSYDIIYKAPKFDDKKALTEPAFITVLHNGVLIQNHTEILGSTVARGTPTYVAHGCEAITLQDHGSQVSFRNIWLRKLNTPHIVLNY